MWLSQRVAGTDTADTMFVRGKVTISGDNLSVDADGELRGVEVLAPAGMKWKPSGGSDVLVIKNDGGAAALCAAPTATADELAFTVGDGAVTLKHGGIELRYGGGSMVMDGNGITLRFGNAGISLGGGGISLTCGGQYINLLPDVIDSTIKNS